MTSPQFGCADAGEDETGATGSSGPGASSSSGTTDATGASGTSSEAGTGGSSSDSSGEMGETGEGPSFTVGGSVHGLTGQMSLLLDFHEPVEIAADGSFTFSTKLATGAPYHVVISRQPEHQTCQLMAGEGTIASANVTNLTVHCVDHEAQWLMVQDARGVALSFDDSVTCPEDATFRGVMTLANTDLDTTWFSDRPDRLMAHSTTQAFVEQWPTIFAPARGGAPNAVLAFEAEDGAETTLVLSLQAPQFSPMTQDLRYEVCGVSTETPAVIAGIDVTPASLDAAKQLPLDHQGEVLLFIDATVHRASPNWVMLQDAVDITFDLNGADVCPDSAPFGGTMTLPGIDPDTLWLTDRPFHFAARSHTDAFVEVWNRIFSAETGSAPNAVVAWSEAGVERVVTLELFAPKYDPNEGSLSYTVCAVPAQAPDQVLGVPLISEGVFKPEAFPAHDGRITLFIDAADAANCDLAIPKPVPGFNCSDAELIPSSINPGSNPQTCNKPEMLYNRCAVNGRLGRLSDGSGPSGVDIIYSCRKRQSDGIGDYFDIAVIQHNRKNGATCFYQWLGSSNGENIPAPASPAGKQFWTAGVDYCSSCHANGPYIRSPDYWQVLDGTGQHLLPPIGALNKYYLANRTSYQVYNVYKSGGNKCTNCHNIGAYRTAPTQPLQLGRVNLAAAGTRKSISGSPAPTPSTYSDFMVHYITPDPGKTPRETAVAALDELNACLAVPTPADCGIVTQSRAGVCPPIVSPNGKSCYWMENTSGNYCWVNSPSGSTNQQGCQNLDSCSRGGGGGSGGGCYKWADCSDCPPTAWP